MRKVKLQMQVSLDGFVAGPNGEMDWMTWNWDDELKEYVMKLTEPIDCIILGRVLAQGFIPHWTAAAQNPESDSFTHKMVDTPKVVFSKTLFRRWVVMLAIIGQVRINACLLEWLGVIFIKRPLSAAAFVMLPSSSGKLESHL